MKEAFLHYIWKTRRFDQHNLKTTHGQKISILDWGSYNEHGGPDFHEGKVQIDNTLWVGQIEHHVKSSEWYVHGHQHDKAYDQVVLHVVYEEDKVVKRSNGTSIPCLELKGRIPSGLYKKYLRLMHQSDWIPCKRHIANVSEIKRNLWLDRVLVERLANATKQVNQEFERNNRNWETTFYHLLAGGFGLRVNKEPFIQLARSLPLIMIQRHRHSLFQIEALLFGQAGMLARKFEDEYPRRLQKEYSFLKEKYELMPMRLNSWNFGRIRPANFPTIRIAQFAVLLFQSAHLFSKILVAKNVKELENTFDVKISHYWLTHFQFEKESIYRHKSLGKSTIHLLIINIIIPLLFFYGQYKRENRFKDKALELLEAMPAENNKVLKRWEDLGISLTNAYRTQALLELKKNYCDQQACLKCSIGDSILKSG